MEGEKNNVTNEVMYKECLKNHAASLGSYATDGCGEFITLDDANSLTGGRLNCSACGCHRNFHHKVTHGGSRTMAHSPDQSTSSEGAGSKKRFRTKFTEEQKEKMLGFAEKLGWRMQRRDGDQLDEIERFCRGVGVSRKVFKVWMHNHKMNFRLH